MKRASLDDPREEKQILREVQQRYHITENERTNHEAGRHTQSVLRDVRPQRRLSAFREVRRGSHIARKVVLAMFILLLTGTGIFGYKILAAGTVISVSEQSLFGQLKDLFFSSGEYLAGEADGRVNVLLIAIGGEGHKGKDLADTIIVVSIRPANNEVALLSIPRDMYVQVPGEEYFSKLNAVHSYGESKKEGLGPKLLKERIEDITGLPIHYYGRVDFTAFKSIVDALGGIEITIDESFYDYWHKISFPAGTEKMNGERALAYVRARYIEGPQGGDFRRAQRQQQVLIAMREKIFSVNTAFDFRLVSTILDSLSENIRTDMKLWEMKRFFEIARTINPSNVRSLILTSGIHGPLVGSTEVLGGVPAAVLRTRTGDFSEIRSIAANIFSVATNEQLAEQSQQTEVFDEKTPVTPEEKETTTPEEKTTIEIRNGTTITGLAKRSSEFLGDEYEILSVGNAANSNHAETVVYVISAVHASAGQQIAESFEAAADNSMPAEEEKTKAHILIILGEDIKEILEKKE